MQYLTSPAEVQLHQNSQGYDESNDSQARYVPQYRTEQNASIAANIGASSVPAVHCRQPLIGTHGRHAPALGKGMTVLHPNLEPSAVPPPTCSTADSVRHACTTLHTCLQPLKAQRDVQPTLDGRCVCNHRLLRANPHLRRMVSQFFASQHTHFLFPGPDSMRSTAANTTDESSTDCWYKSCCTQHKTVPSIRAASPSPSPL